MRSKGYSTQFVSVCVLANSYAVNVKVQSKTRIEANAVLKVFDSWISLKTLCSKVTALFAHPNEL